MVDMATMETKIERAILNRYRSDGAVNMFKAIVTLFSLLVLTPFSLLANQPVKNQIVVFPFDQKTISENFPWVSEALTDLISQAGTQAGYQMISRSDRLDVYNILGLSPWRRPTLAMQIEMAEYLQATHVIYGTYQTDGKTLSTNISFLDLQKLSLLKSISISIALSDLPDMKQKLCTKLFNDDHKDTASTCPPSEHGEGKISGKVYERFIKAMMEDSYERREEYLKQVLRLSPDFHRATITLGQLYFDNLEFDRAEELLKNIENKRSTLGAEACMILGEIYLEKKDYPSAINVLKKAISYGGSGKSHYLLAKAYAHLGDFKKAIKESDLSLKLDSSYIDAREFRKWLRKKEKSF